MIIRSQIVLRNEAKPGSHAYADVWTIHEYARSEVITIIDRNGIHVTGIAHIFRCTETSVERRYGFDSHHSHGEIDRSRGAHA